MRLESLLWLDACLSSLRTKLGVLGKVILDTDVAVLRFALLQSALQVLDLPELVAELAFKGLELLLETVYASVALAELCQLEDVSSGSLLLLIDIILTDLLGLLVDWLSSSDLGWLYRGDSLERLDWLWLHVLLGERRWHVIGESGGW